MLALGPNPTSNPRLPRHARATPRPPTGPRGGPALRGAAGGAGAGGGDALGRSRRALQATPGPGARGPRGGPGAGGGASGRPPSAAAGPPEQVAAGEGRGPLRLRVGVRSAARTRLLVLLVEFFNHLGRLPSAQTHRNRPRRRSRRAEDAAGRPAPYSHTGWAGGPSLGAKARPPRAAVAALTP